MREIIDGLYTWSRMSEPHGSPGRCSLLPEEKLDDPARLRESLRDLLALDFDCLLVGDGTPILEGAKAQLEDLVASFQA